MPASHGVGCASPAPLVVGWVTRLVGVSGEDDEIRRWSTRGPRLVQRQNVMRRTGR